jgi:hypothetical protein
MRLPSSPCGSTKKRKYFDNYPQTLYIAIKRQRGFFIPFYRWLRANGIIAQPEYWLIRRFVYEKRFFFG